MPQSNKVKQAFAISTTEGYKDQAVARAQGTGHPGFRTVQVRIAKMNNPRTGKPYGMQRAGAILAARRNNSRSRSVSNA